VRVVAAVVLLGIFCVGASAYLVQATVTYFDARLGEALEHSEEIADTVEPFYTDLVAARKEAYQARASSLALETALALGIGTQTSERAAMLELLERERDLVRLRLRREGEEPVEVNRVTACPDEDLWYPTEAPLGTAISPGLGGELEVVFCRDPQIDARFQALGRHKREIGFEQTQQPELERTAFRVIGVASAIVLAIALLVGILVARATTRKVSELSQVMARVARGDLDARVRQLGPDELGQLGAAFNGMLDELAAAQQKVAYLQRIGAWQEMARRIAHEIKNPLTPIQLAVQQLRDKDPELSPEFSRLLETSAEIVEDEIEGLRRMVSSFSLFAKVPEVQRARITLSEVLEEFERAYGHVMERERARLEVESPDAAVEIMGDRQLLKQALVNLVENAVQAGREAGHTTIRVRVSTTLVGKEARWVEVCVADNGPGVSHDRREQVFEPYETTREEGTGLGLAIVKKIVLDHGGEIRVEDSGLGGAAFVVRLPGVESEAGPG
jgi:nitrogen fixation/metabolism regulation signal transduction histidine kinase